MAPGLLLVVGRLPGPLLLLLLLRGPLRWLRQLKVKEHFGDNGGVLDMEQL